ncbi:putative RNA polymerase sigma factor rpoD [Hibiscus syriacus]|uniref:RNA polymerase sigma factor rpoD n=1 Tax=Hibiscus syriacus TaxID=106335 RepID=A0A6A2XRS7_HIBSY|nr:putative RNA polymerase sigma factor rpoD [Hibiscus syriacus]
MDRVSVRPPCEKARGSSITLEFLAPTFAKEAVKEAIPVSSLTAFSSVCSILLIIEFGSSPTSILASPPLSPSSESPATSPSGSFNSVNELAASMRSLQLGKAKMSCACSHGMQMGPGFGSPCGSTLPPGFCSSPSTLTRTPTRSSLGKCDFWECNAFELEEPAMERVECGRDLSLKGKDVCEAEQGKFSWPSSTNRVGS